MTQYSGKVIRKTPVTPTQQAASGVWKLNEQAAAIRNNNWPVPGVPNPISRSVRLRSSASANLTRTPSVSGNRKTWTWSGWLKRGSLSQTGTIWGSNFSSGGFGLAFGNYSGAGVSPEIIGVTLYAVGTVTTSAVFRDPSAWYHIVAKFDSTQATQANRFALYVNGVQQTLSGTLNVTLNADYNVNLAGALHVIGGESGYFNDCYLTEINFIDGQALTPSSFGTTDPLTGVWEPIPYTGTYGTNGFYLNFKDNTSTTTLGYDYSGNSNNWTANNISLTSGVTYDSMLDVPTQWIGYSTTTDTSAVTRGNYAVLNPLALGTSQTSLTQGNLYAIPTSGASNWGTVFSSIAIPTSGKWYAEATAVVYNGSGNNSSLGVVDGSTFIPTNTAILYQYSTGEGFDGILCHLFNDYVAPISDGTQGTNVTGITGTSVNLMLALDVDNGKVYAGYNGTWLNSGNPAGGTGEVATRTFSANDVVAGHTSWNGSNDQAQYFNFGQRPFSYTVPTGFKSLVTTNLPTSTIVQGNQWMDATLWTGNGSSQTITNSAAMAPDFVWVKERSSTSGHTLYDTIRGATKYLESNATAAEGTDATTLTAFNSNGFSVGSSGALNQSAQTYVGWQWKAGGTPAVTNTSGSITSTVSASTTAGFSVVTYTGTGSVATVGHGLGVAPSMMIVKSRSTAGTDWAVYHRSLGGTRVMVLNSTSAAITIAGSWNNTDPTSSVFTVGTGSGSGDTNGSSRTYVNYLFAPVAGYSAFGSYTGNGSADGPFVYLGFRPRFIMLKRTDAVSGWGMIDTARGTYNTIASYLQADSSAAELTDNSFDILSNGFKCRLGGNLTNTNGGTYIYAAFAENPFKNSLAR